MKWVEARHLEQWAQRNDARYRLSELVWQLVRASAVNIASIRFPTGDNAQLPGYDARVTAVPGALFASWLPEGDSVWEFGTSEDYFQKINDDFDKRTASPGDSVDPSKTTLVLVTPRKWARSTPDISTWIQQKKQSTSWKGVRVIDAVAIENWLDICPAVAAHIARDIVGSLPETGAYSPEEFWNEYSNQFRPRLTEQVVLAGREPQSTEVIQQLVGPNQISSWQGDSVAEVTAFITAAIRQAEPERRKFLDARVLIVERKDAGRQLAGLPNLIFIVKGEAIDLAGMMAAASPVIIPVGRESLRNTTTITLKRPSTSDMAAALQSMGIPENECHRRARECDRSVTILARRIPSATAKLPSWHADTRLIPALLAGAWDSASEHDRAVLAQLAGVSTYDMYESTIRDLLLVDDAPLQREGTVWAVRAPVDVFSYIAPLIGSEHLTRLSQVSAVVFGEPDPALELSVDDRPFAKLRGASLSHSGWVRDGLATTLLIIAALGGSVGLHVPESTPQGFADRIVREIPGLRGDPRILSSLSHQLPLLMEAAPGPLLDALEHLLKGDGAIRAIFQDTKTSLWASSPHTGVLWAIELIAWDPRYLTRAALVLASLDQIDPGGTLSNRPLNSLREILLPWHPQTNAILTQRIAVLDEVLASNEQSGWRLLVKLLPRGHDIGGNTLKPRFREAGASETEVLTHRLLYDTYRQITNRAIAHAANLPERWEEVLNVMHAFPHEQRDFAICELATASETMGCDAREALWIHVSDVVRHHSAYPNTDWALDEAQLSELRRIADRIAPNDAVKRAIWLFTERIPEIGFTSADDLWKEIEARRNEATKAIWHDLGLDGILRLAQTVEAQRYVGYAAAQTVPTIEVAQDTTLQAIATGSSLQSFVTWFSAAAHSRFSAEWKDWISDLYRKSRITADQFVSLIVSWPHNRATWEFVDTFDEPLQTAYWQSKLAWGLEGDGPDVEYAVDRYLAVHRAEAIIDALAMKAKQISTPRILQALDQFEVRVGENPNILNNQTLGWDVQQFFAELERRPDATLTDIASREYRYFPLLKGEFPSDRNSPLAIERYMSENPAFYVQILCDVFRPASERGQDRSSISEEQQLRARWGWTLLDGLTHLPGSDGSEINTETLKAWVDEVRRLASEADRAVIADQKIGALLAHCAFDPEDNVWPHKAIRACLETWKSEEIERGMHIEKLNMRGVTTRAYREGGEQEHKLAAEARLEAQKVKAWPRTRDLLLSLADSWESQGNREDLAVRQEELREM